MYFKFLIPPRAPPLCMRICIVASAFRDIRGAGVPACSGAGTSLCGISSYSPGVDEAFAVSGILPPPSAMLFPWHSISRCMLSASGVPGSRIMRDCGREALCRCRLSSHLSDLNSTGTGSLPRPEPGWSARGCRSAMCRFPTRMASVMALSLCMSVMERGGERERCALFAAVPGNVSVGAFRPLELYPRTPERLGGDEADIEPATFGFEYPGGDFRSRLAKHPYASSCHFGIGVDHPYGHTPETFLPEQQDCKGSLAVM